jgi:hypothetical protein
MPRSFDREAAEITALVERLESLIKEFYAASAEQEPALRAEIVRVKERIKRFAWPAPLAPADMR